MKFIGLLFLLMTMVMALPFEKLHFLELDEGTVIPVRTSEKWLLKRNGVRFMDLTGLPHLFGSESKKMVVPDYEYPNQVRKHEIVNSLAKMIDTGLMHDRLSKFTSFFTRYYKSETGYESALWLEDTIKNITSPLKDDIAVNRFVHQGWKQFSIIVSIIGDENPESIVVMGSHQDSMNLLLPSILAAPGADDNGSGTITNLEALRLFVDHMTTSGFRPKNTIEFHFYSAEEGGLLGSLDVFTRYAKEGKRVVTMLQQDMTGYVEDPSNERIGIVTDYTNGGLNEFVKLMIDAYLDITYVETECGYACSDNGSATKNGFPASLVIENDIKKTNRYIHSTMDTLDRLSFDHMAKHTIISIASIFELSDWHFNVKDENNKY